VVAACARAGRDPGEVAILAATKYTDSPGMVHLAALGQRLFGENRVQDARAKVDEMPAMVRRAVELHMIGHLQSNKARGAAALFDMVQSVHSLALAEALGRGAAAAGKRLPVLLQVNVAGDPRKAGLTPGDLDALVTRVMAVEAIEVRGLMTIGPAVRVPEDSRPVFRALRELRDRLAPAVPPGAMEHLSMGMSGDFEVAIEEGATIVRVGTALVGPRR
jgi:pyridoxal phosphate enzyme (YggS family)